MMEGKTKDLVKEEVIFTCFTFFCMLSRHNFNPRATFSSKISFEKYS
jgi:hypothetical protein